MITTTYKIVAFIDILGFSKIIERYDNGEIPHILDELKSAIDPAAKLVRESIPLSEGSPFFNWKECLDIRLFSDCLCASAPLEYESYNFIDQLKFFYKYIMGFQIVLMEKGFFTRGAVTVGSHYSDENMIFSGGLVEAYKLESSKAVFPRIIASDTLIQHSIEFSESHAADLDYMLVRDEEGTAFFNHFNYNLIDSQFTDKMVADIMKSTGIDGIFDETFEEKDLRDKEETLVKIKELCKIEIEAAESDSVKSKHIWLTEFIDFELNGTNKRGFETFKNWR